MRKHGDDLGKVSDQGGESLTGATKIRILEDPVGKVLVLSHFLGKGIARQLIQLLQFDLALALVEVGLIPLQAVLYELLQALLVYFRLAVQVLVSLLLPVVLTNSYALAFFGQFYLVKE